MLADQLQRVLDHNVQALAGEKVTVEYVERLNGVIASVIPRIRELENAAVPPHLRLPLAGFDGKNIVPLKRPAGGR